MFCMKCGNKCAEGEAFCSNCGAPLTEEQNAATVNPEQQYVQEGAPYGAVQQGGFYASSAPEQKKKKMSGAKKALIAACSVLCALVLVAGVAFLVFPSKIKSLFMSSTDYFRYVQKREVTKISEDFNDFSDNVSLDVNDISGEIDLSISINAAPLEAMGADVSQFEWLSDVGLALKAKNEDGNTAAEAVVSVSGKTVATVELKSEDGIAYIRIPELSDKYLAFDASALSSMFSSVEPDYFDGDYGFDLQSMASSLPMQLISKISGNLPSEEKLSEIFEKYIHLVIDKIENVEKESVTLTAGDISEKCSAYKVKIDTKLLASILKAVIEEAKADEDIKAIVSGIAKDFAEAAKAGGASVTEKDIEDEIYGALDTILDEIGEAEAGEAQFTGAEYTLFVADNDEVRGFEVTVLSEEADLFHFICKDAKDGENEATEFELTSGHTGKISGSGSGVNGATGYTGDFVVRAEIDGKDEDVLKLAFENFDSESAKKGYLSGKVTVSPGKALAQLISSRIPSGSMVDGSSITGVIAQVATQVKLEFDFDHSGSEQKFDGSLKVLGQKFVSVSGSLDLCDVKIDGSVPAEGDYILSDDGEGFSEWMQTFDFEGFISGLKDAGVPAELFEGLAGLMDGDLSDDTLPFGLDFD
ncbi:MAG: zinc ribbon domain-containing protein [Clostridia bacterium]|nr:zinc ribbon domain-containing protein [Clostridia bacterium]